MQSYLGQCWATRLGPELRKLSRAGRRTATLRVLNDFHFLTWSGCFYIFRASVYVEAWQSTLFTWSDARFDYSRDSLSLRAPGLCQACQFLSFVRRRSSCSR